MKGKQAMRLTCFLYLYFANLYGRCQVEPASISEEVLSAVRWQTAVQKSERRILGMNEIPAGFFQKGRSYRRI